MKSTQKKQNEGNKGNGNGWQMPERAQVFVTPGAQKKIEEAQQQGEQVRIAKTRPASPAANSPTAPHDAKGSDAIEPSPAPARSDAQKRSHPQKKPKKLTLKEAILAELRDRLRTLRMGIQVNSEDIIRALICGGLLILFAMLQTTFFVRFAPFGAVPDLMLVFVLAIGVQEGEKWGSVTGLVAAFVIQALGTSGSTPELLSLVYMPVGCFGGLLSKYYFRHTLPVKAVYVLVSALLRGIVTVITALVSLRATLGEILLRIFIPEYFSTVILSPIPFLAVWLCFRRFHKTRAERTDRQSD